MADALSEQGPYQRDHAFMAEARRLIKNHAALYHEEIEACLEEEGDSIFIGTPALLDKLLLLDEASPLELSVFAYASATETSPGPRDGEPRLVTFSFEHVKTIKAYYLSRRLGFQVVRAEAIDELADYNNQSSRPSPQKIRIAQRIRVADENVDDYTKRVKLLSLLPLAANVPDDY